MEFRLEASKMRMSPQRQRVKPINYNLDFKNDLPKAVNNIKTVIKSKNNTVNQIKISDSEFMTEWNNENNQESTSININHKESLNEIDKTQSNQSPDSHYIDKNYIENTTINHIEQDEVLSNDNKSENESVKQV